MPASPAPVIVVGAGLAGVAAACTLAEHGIPVQLLEQSSRIGGRVATVRGIDGAPHPLGSHLFLGCCTAFLRLLDQLGTRPLTRLQPRLRLAVSDAGRLTILQASPLKQPLGLLPALIRYPLISPAGKLAIARTLTRLNCTPGETFAAWLNRHRQPPDARRFFWELIAQPALNATPAEAAADLALLVFRTAVLGAGTSCALGYLPPDSSALLAPVATYLAARGGALRLNSPVSALLPDAQGFRIRLANAQCLPASACVLAVPQYELPRLLPPAWRAAVQQAAELPGRPIVDVQLVYNRPITTEPVVSIPGTPAVWLFPQPPTAAGQRVDVSISCPGPLAELPAEDCVKWADARLRAALPPVTAELTAARVNKHMRATFSAAPVHQSLRPDSVTPIPRLVCAGDWTNTGWPATMEGAVRSGIAAAKAVISSLKT